ncbi:MAG: type II toxin-antitoxin system prevent-host-death family antitoxin [Propionibacteriaceae bacterium]|jgi:prevent-host-death family protein|nr:type II toxin-antitoxin system prevent-host-death family antitoxin [Propionibacteriaceae bacterium]
MITVNMLEAKTNLSKLVDSVERGEETEIILARNGRPAARLTRIEYRPKPSLLGIARGKFSFNTEAFDAMDDDIADMFGLTSVERD